MAIKKNSSKSSDKGITKSGFIRSLPDRTPAKEVIAKAKDAGLELKEKLVWTVQSEMRSEAKGGAKKPAKKAAQSTSAPAAALSRAPAASAKSNGKKGSKKKAPTKVAAKATAIAHSSGAEQKMKAFIVQLGTTRADELYRSVRKELEALVAN